MGDARWLRQGVAVLGVAVPPRPRADSTTEMVRIRASFDAVMGIVLLSDQLGLLVPSVVSSDNARRR
jgi:hypothetical protein